MRGQIKKQELVSYEDDWLVILDFVMNEAKKERDDKNSESEGCKYLLKMRKTC